MDDEKMVSVDLASGPDATTIILENGNKITTLPSKESMRSPRGQRLKISKDDPWYMGDENDIFAEDIMDDKPTKVIGWTNWCEDSYPEVDTSTPEEFEDIRRIVIKTLRYNGYHWDGGTHQNADFGAPVFDNDTKGLFSMRGWGKVMALAYPDEVDDSDGMGYCDWAWTAAEKQVSRIKTPPESEWLPKTSEDNNCGSFGE